MSIDQVGAMESPDAVAIESENLFEEIDGHRVELLPMSFFANWLAARFFGFLFPYTEANNLGITTVEALFHLAGPIGRNRRPDVAFVSRSRWPKTKPLPRKENALDVTPNLMIEIISPTDLIEDVMEKVEEYFSAGAEQVWVVYPNQSKVQVFASATESRWFTRDDKIENVVFLPGFQLALSDIFVDHA